MVIFVGSGPGKRGDDLGQRDVFYVAAGVFKNLGKTAAGGVGSFLIFYVIGGRAEKKVPVDGRGDQYPFPVFPGQGINRVFYMGAGDLSSRQYSPFLGVMCIALRLTMLWIWSAYTPAALTTHFAARAP